MEHGELRVVTSGVLEPAACVSCDHLVSQGAVMHGSQQLGLCVKSDNTEGKAAKVSQVDTHKGQRACRRMQAGV
jgi:hypothetical protein